MPRKLVTTFIAVFVSVTLSAPAALAANWNTNTDNVVLDGYDVVAYRTQVSAIKGLSRYRARYEGADFHFASQENRDAFAKNPAMYAPKYNAYCAFAMGAKGAKVPANPDSFKFYNGELLVFFNDMHQDKKFNTQVPWNADERDLYSKAEQNWKSLEIKP
jgi:YHS domain-containing protein